MLSTKLAVATHILLLVAIAGGAHNLTSVEIASSIGKNSSLIRGMMVKLQKAGLLRSRRGPGGTSLTREPCDISLLDVLRAVEPTSGIHMHSVGKGASTGDRRMLRLIEASADEASIALREELARVSLADIMPGFDIEI